MTARFSIECELDYSVSSPACFLFNIQAASVRHHKVLNECLSLSGAARITEHVQQEYGNRFIRVTAFSGQMKVKYSTELVVEHVCMAPANIDELPIATLPAEVLPFLLPSRYCESDRLMQMAHSVFGSLPHGYARVEAVCDWVNSHIRYVPGITDSSTSAVDTLAIGMGVCRDFAHVTIALLRALNIPARFVTSYDYGVDSSYGPTDFHAYVEAFLGDRWWIFDATRLCPRNGLVRIGTGRDAADVAFATIFGSFGFNGMRLNIRPVGMDIVDSIDVGFSTCGLGESTHLPRPGANIFRSSQATVAEAMT